MKPLFVNEKQGVILFSDLSLIMKLSWSIVLFMELYYSRVLYSVLLHCYTLPK